MPTVRHIGAARFFFYSDEGAEPPHIHVEQGQPCEVLAGARVSLAASSRLRGHEFRRLQRLVAEHRDEFLEAWHDFFQP
jgi:hypothetical protein